MDYELGMTTGAGASMAAMLVAVFFLSGSTALYFFWFQPRTKRVLLVLQQLTAALTLPEDDWEAAKARAIMVVKTPSWALAAWRATESRVIPMPKGSTSTAVMLVSPRDLWTPQHLLERQINGALAQAIPVLMLCIGVLLTLLFMVLQSHDRSPMGMALIPVMTGLGASMAWTVAAQQRLGELQRSAQDVLDALEHLAPAVGGAFAAMAQRQQAHEQQQLLQQQQDTAQALLNETRRSLALMTALLTDTKGQSDVLRRIDTELPCALATAVSHAILPPSQRLISALDGFKNELLGLHRDALKSMLCDFSAVLKQATAAEVTHLRATLESFSTRLDTAGLTIGFEIVDAAKTIDKAGKLLSNRIEKAATELTRASDAVTLSVKEVEATLKETALLGQQGNQSLTDGLELADVALVQLKEVVDRLAETASTMQRVSGGVGHALAALQMKISGSARRS